MKTVWIFDVNRRVYRRGASGRPTGGPIWREHWQEHEIAGETSRSYITRSGKKVPKKGGHGIAFDADEIDRLAYVHENRYKISDAVLRLEDYDTLVKIAEIIGYKTEENPT